MIDTHGIRVKFGKYKGELVTRLPVDYLEWHINENTNFKNLAKAEMQRRGVEPGSRNKIDISAHALDRASLRILDIWQAERKKNEGLHSYLVRICIEGLKHVPDQASTFKIEYEDMKLVFRGGKLYPILLTVIRIKPDENNNN